MISSDNDHKILYVLNVCRVIQLSSLSYGAEFTIPDQQSMKSILHMIRQNLSNHNLGFQLQLLSVL